MPRSNPKPLTIGLIGMSSLEPEWQALVDKGHTVGAYEALETPDVVVGPRCYRIDPALGMLEKQIEMLIVSVRNIKYPKETKNAKHTPDSKG